MILLLLKRTVPVGCVRRHLSSAAARDFPPQASVTVHYDWKPEIAQYVSYNQEYLDGELVHAKEQEEQRKNLPRKEKIRSGQLAKITDWSYVRKNVYTLIGHRKLPTNNELVKGQSVELRDHAYSAKGVISQLSIGNNEKKRPNFTVEFHDNSQNSVDMERFDWNVTALEYTTDLTPFERMQKTLATIRSQVHLPAWLMLTIATKTGTLESRANDLSQIVMNDSEQCCVNEIKKFMAGQTGKIAMNKSQKEAIVNSVACALSVIQGPPGTSAARH